MRVYRVMVYRRGNLELDVFEDAGELVERGSTREWHRRIVLADAGGGLDYTPDWRPTRREALELAIANVENAQASTAAVLDDLRNRLVNEHHRPLPAEAALHGQPQGGCSRRSPPHTGSR